MLHLTPSERVIAWRLTEGRPVPCSELVVALYSHDPDGGPLDAKGCVRQFVERVRDKLRQFGIPVRIFWSSGWWVPADKTDDLRSLLADEIRRNVPSDSPNQRLRRPAVSEERVAP